MRSGHNISWRVQTIQWVKQLAKKHKVSFSLMAEALACQGMECLETHFGRTMDEGKLDARIQELKEDYGN